jgi:hypothetical protein
MFNKFSCTCGHELFAWEGMTRVRCAACGQVLDNPILHRDGSAEADKAPGFVVFGLSQPAALVPQVELKYQVVQIAEERTPPIRNEVRELPSVARADEDDRVKTYPVSEVGRENGQKSQVEMWAPEAELRPPWTRYKPRYRSRRSGWPLEKYCFDCLLYPLRACLLVGGLGFALAVSSFGLLQVLRDVGAGAWLFLPMWLAALGYATGFLTCTFRSGMCGEVTVVRWPAGDVLLVVRSLLALVLSFLAGPIIPLAVALYYWLHAGRLDAIDSAILLELLFTAVGWWFLTFLSVSRRHRWSDINPGIVLKRAYQLGYRCLGVLGLLFAFTLFHGLIAVVALESPAGGDLMLMLVGAVGSLFCMTFLIRWVGICVHRQLAPTRPRKIRILVDEREAKALDCRWIDC